MSKEEPIITSHYAFPGKILLKNKVLLIDFVFQKIAYQFKNPYSPWVFFAYFLPLMGYLLCKSIFHKYFSATFNVRPIMLMALLGIGFDMFILRNNYNLLALILGLIWVFGIFYHKIKPQTSILIALTLLIWCPFFLIAHMEWVAEKMANWVFIFTSIGFAQFMFETFRMVPDRHPREDGDPV